MSYYALDVDGEGVDTELDDEPRVTLTFGEPDEESTCTACGQDVTFDGDRWSGGNYGTVCLEAWSDDPVAPQDDDGGIPDYLDGSDAYPHTVPPAGAEGWANGAGIDVRDDGQRIDVWISLGDPRGAFVMSAERITHDDGHTEVRLSVPTPETMFLHLPLTALASPGYYRVGRTS